MTLAAATYFNLRTQKKDGTLVSTPVWFVRAPEADTYHVFANINSGKVKRIRNFEAVQVAVCDWQGKLLGDWQSGQAELVAESDAIYDAFRSKYRMTFKVIDFFSKLFGKHKERQIIRVVIPSA
ncbi:MAG: pyridoxamine 5'-phosphate oxidase family protein [Pseudomonadota bacterium]|nr:pyridoxamine 5'-phosphate oxidase family protein [Pseudomonadota bacterium]